MNPTPCDCLSILCPVQTLIQEKNCPFNISLIIFQDNAALFKFSYIHIKENGMSARVNLRRPNPLYAVIKQLWGVGTSLESSEYVTTIKDNRFNSYQVTYRKSHQHGSQKSFRVTHKATQSGNQYYMIYLREVEEPVVIQGIKYDVSGNSHLSIYEYTTRKDNQLFTSMHMTLYLNRTDKNKTNQITAHVYFDSEGHFIQMRLGDQSIAIEKVRDILLNIYTIYGEPIIQTLQSTAFEHISVLQQQIDQLACGLEQLHRDDPELNKDLREYTRMRCRFSELLEERYALECRKDISERVKDECTMAKSILTQCFKKIETQQAASSSSAQSHCSQQTIESPDDSGAERTTQMDSPTDHVEQRPVIDDGTEEKELPQLLKEEVKERVEENKQLKMQLLSKSELSFNETMRIHNRILMNNSFITNQLFCAIIMIDESSAFYILEYVDFVPNEIFDVCWIAIYVCLYCAKDKISDVISFLNKIWVHFKITMVLDFNKLEESPEAPLKCYIPPMIRAINFRDVRLAQVIVKAQNISFDKKYPKFFRFLLYQQAFEKLMFTPDQIKFMLNNSFSVQKEMLCGFFFFLPSTVSVAEQEKSINILTALVNVDKTCLTRRYGPHTDLAGADGRNVYLPLLFIACMRGCLGLVKQLVEVHHVDMTQQPDLLISDEEIKSDETSQSDQSDLSSVATFFYFTGVIRVSSNIVSEKWKRGILPAAVSDSERTALRHTAMFIALVNENQEVSNYLMRNWPENKKDLLKNILNEYRIWKMKPGKSGGAAFFATANTKAQEDDLHVNAGSLILK